MTMLRRWLSWGDPLGVYRDLPLHGFTRDATFGM